MVLEALKTQVDSLNAEERHELSVYLAKLELENDPDYWKIIRSRSEDSDRKNWISAEDL